MKMKYAAFILVVAIQVLGIQCENCTRTNNKNDACAKPCDPTHNNPCKSRACMCDGDCGYSCVKSKECNQKLGMKSKDIPNESITSSSQLKNHAPFDARLEGRKAWCSALEDKSPYIQILLDEEKSITAIETQGSSLDFSWSRKYDVWYLKEGKWTLFKEGLTGNRNTKRPHKNYINPPIKTTSIRIYPKDPLVMDITTPIVPCLRLELYGCSAPDACASPPKIAHGLHDGNDYRIGRRVRYSCNTQYVLEGSAVITCLDGHWVGKVPVCRAPCPLPKVPTNGFVFGDNLQHQGSVQFWCDVGFVLRGSSTSQCDDGHWNSPTPRCEGPTKDSCQKPPIPRNAYMLPSQAQKQWFSHAARVYYRCKPGYSPVGFSIQRCKNGVWSRLAFSCVAKSCGHPGTLVFGKINSYVFTYNSTVEYSCNQGYILVGTTKRVCQANQTWTGSLPRCTWVGCGRLPTPANGVKVTKSSTVVRFRCKGQRRYKLVGSSTRRCLESGLWSGQQPSCQLIKCNDPGTPENGERIVRGNGFLYLGSLQYTCNKNYKIEGVSRIYCLEGGYWSRPRPRCLPVTVPCSHPGTPENGRLSGNNFSHNATVHFKCKGRYRLVGAKKLKCNNGKWNGQKPRCEQKQRGKR